MVLFLHVTSRVEGEDHPGLQQEKGFQGVPALCFLDADGAVLAVEPERNVAAFQRTLQRVQRLRQLQAAVPGTATAAARRELFLLEVELDRLGRQQIEAGQQQHELDAAQADLVARRLVDLEVRELQAGGVMPGDERFAERIAAMAKAGRRPGPRTALTFWVQSLQHAARVGDGGLAATAFGEAERLVAEKPQLASAMARWRQLLAQAQRRRD